MNLDAAAAAHISWQNLMHVRWTEHDSALMDSRVINSSHRRHGIKLMQNITFHEGKPICHTTERMLQTETR